MQGSFERETTMIIKTRVIKNVKRQ